jgi:hypothetical protein
VPTVLAQGTEASPAVPNFLDQGTEVSPAVPNFLAQGAEASSAVPAVPNVLAQATEVSPAVPNFLAQGTEASKAMTEIMDHHEAVTQNALGVLEDTSDALLNHPYVAEDAMAVSSMCPGAIAKSLYLRLDHENTAIMEAIWRLQQIVDSNQTELNDIRSRIEAQLEKRKYFATLNETMLKSYADVHSAEDELKKLEGAAEDDDREKAKGTEWHLYMLRKKKVQCNAT